MPVGILSNLDGLILCECEAKHSCSEFMGSVAKAFPSTSAHPPALTIVPNSNSTVFPEC